MKIYERLITKGLATTKIPATSAKAGRARISVRFKGKPVAAATLQGKPQ
jgi:hypothetical protein